jgi:hypothetical protein
MNLGDRVIVGGASKKQEFVSSAVVKDISFNPKDLAEETRHFLDPADKRLELTIIFNSHQFLSFLRNWIIIGIDDQTEVRCLIPIEETIRYSARTHGGASTVHGSNLSIYDAFQHLPIDQRLELDTRFSISVPIVEPPYAKAIFSDKIIPVDKIPGKILPFNRRNYLLCIEPGESLSMQLRVGYAPNFSTRERTHWWPIGENGLGIGTQLGRDPIAYLQLIVQQLIRRIDQPENNRLDYLLKRAGLIDQRDKITSYILAAGQEILSLRS